MGWVEGNGPWVVSFTGYLYGLFPGTRLVRMLRADAREPHRKFLGERWDAREYITGIFHRNLYLGYLARAASRSYLARHQSAPRPARPVAGFVVHCSLVGRGPQAACGASFVVLKLWSAIQHSPFRFPRTGAVKPFSFLAIVVLLRLALSGLKLANIARLHTPYDTL